MAGSFGSVANDIATLFEDKVNLPNAPQVNLGDQQGIATQSNINNLPGAEDLASKTNSFNFDQIQSMLRKAIPGYDQLVSKQRDIIGSELNGEVPQDVQDAIQRNAATRSVAGGYAGSGMARNLTARDLGMTSLALTNQGLDSASRWLTQMKSTALPSMFNLSSMFITPEQQAQNTWQNEISKYQRDSQQNIIDTAFSNRMTHAAASIGGDTLDLAASIYSGGATSMMGGGGGGASAGGYTPDYSNFQDPKFSPISGGGSGVGGGFDYGKMLKSFMQ